MRLKCCPLCERPVGRLPLLFEQLERFANGTRSYAELAALVDSTPKKIAVAIAHMRRLGFDVSGLVSDRQPYSPEFADHEQMCALRDQGLSWREIGRKYGQSATWAYQKGKKLAATFGPLPGRRVINAKWNPVLMRERIRELREDARLPWKKVANVLDLTPHYVARLYRDPRYVHG